MTIRIYNTLNRKKEIFEPVKQGRVGMYVCGPTVYDSCHIGHARSVLTFDVIARYLKASGFELTYVRNFTDIDDKIINRANQIGIDCKTLAEKYINEFYEDMDALNVERPTIEPRATEHIPQIIKVIEILIGKNLAYQVDGDIFFAIESFKDYGKLSGRKLEDMEAGARVDVDARKRNPFDFALWKSIKPGEPAWDSPWGKGRPGWHIECSAMSTEYLGKTFDIHGGGKDLIFPHHENEIAQSEGAFGKPFAGFWIHNGFVNINQEKMSKSLGNFLMIKDILKSFHPEVVRLFLLSSHYRSPIDFTDKAMNEASTGLNKIYALLERVEEKKELSKINKVEPGKYYKHFCEAMDDDFNTARGIGVLFDAVRNINRLLDESKQGLSQNTIKDIILCKSDILKIGGILGILYESPGAYFEGKKSKSLEKKSIDHVVIEDLVKEREQARKGKKWAEADKIRKQLEVMDIVIEDRPEGTVWRVKS
ncbi:MAG: cysteine--tRNA ligase [Desulfobacteraceae bacterium]|nr:cysteine--tRNA ligase [Desulfobacteraceae bacterium]MBC2720043.1 cysteine--tRNA ligase [Desulfobacteraceae bacterium]